jgi:pyruvate dehydrogenase E2 component (dihydrolipoamide acetyltransferase)
VGEFLMPSLGAGMDVGRVLEWYVEPGDHISRGGIIALVETDKANIEVEVFEAGIVEELLIEAGTKVPVGTPLARIAAEAAAPISGMETSSVEPSGAVAEPAMTEPAVTEPAVTETTLEPVAVGATTAPAPTETRAIDEHPFAISPLVRRQAKDAGVDLATVHGTGPTGAITRHDVAAAAAAPTEAPPATVSTPAPIPAAAGTRSSPYARRLAAERDLDVATLSGSGPGGALLARDLPGSPATTVTETATLRTTYLAPGPTSDRTATAPTGARGAPSKPAADGEDDRALAMRQAIARAMERSNREIPHYHLAETVDVEGMLRWLTERNAELPPAERVLPAAVVLKATALALQGFRDLNGYWIDDAFRPGEGIHLGVAINLRRGGLLAPAMRDVDQRSLDEVMAALKDLVQRTRAGGLRGSELTDPTITVSNLGDTGVERIHGVITPPQVALVGVGRITERPWAVDGLLAVRRTLALSLAGDHRASDGHRGGRFLATIAANLTRPETL